MKIKKAMTLLAAVAMTACAFAAEDIVGSSEWFFVDTTLKISDVTSKYFDGEYGGDKGQKSTFLNGTPCEIEMSVQMDDYLYVDHWLVNGRKFTDHTFKFDVGSIEVGGKLEVVAVGKDPSVRSEPFRVNFDVARNIFEENAGAWVAKPSNSEGVDEIVYTPFGGSPSITFPLAEEKTGSMPDKLNWLPGDWSLAPKIELSPEVRSDGNGSLVLGSVGSKAGVSGTGGGGKKKGRRTPGKIARVMGGDVGATFTGGPLTLSWDPQKLKWVAEEVSVGIDVGGSLGVTHYYPTAVGPVFLEVKGELGLAGTTKFSGLDEGLGGIESSFSLNSERLPKVTVALGYGVNDVLCAKGSVSGMSVLDATRDNGEWTGVRWGIRGSGAVTVTALAFEATLIELTSETLWFINNGSSNSARLMSAAQLGELGWRLQPRDYLAPVRANARLLSAPVRGDVAVVEPGGYPNPTPAMASGVKGDALAYLRDNAARSSANRTELVLRIGASNEWGAAETVWDDGTADFLPSLAAMPDGSIAAAWMNASRTFADDVTIGEFCGAVEIAVGIRDAATGTWTCRNLTSDGAFDFAPAVRAAANGKVLVAWLRNASGEIASSAAEPTDIMAAVYANGQWGDAAVVRSGVGVVHGFDVAFDGENAVLAYSKDADGDPSTAGDAEMYALRLQDGTWGGPVRLTAAGEADGMPLVRAGGAGAFAVLWTAKGKLMESRELALSSAVAVASADGWTLPSNPVMARGAGGRDALVWNGFSEAGGAAGAPTAMIYDPDCGAWGAPVRLFDDGRRESRLSGAVGVGGGLRIGYESASMVTNAAGELSFGATEVRTRLVPAFCDLAVVEDGFSFSTDEFKAGEEVLLTVKTANLGFFPANDATVKVFEEKGGSKTELASVVTNFPGGGVVALKVPWTVDNAQSDLKFTVEVAAGANEEAADARGNNVYSWNACTPDVSFGAVVVRNESATRRRVTANVVNKGLGPLPAGGKVVFRRGGENGEIISEDTIGELWPGEGGVYAAGFTWNLEGVAFTSAWETVCVQLYPDGTIGGALDAADMAFAKVKTMLADVRTVMFNATAGTVLESSRAVSNGCVIGDLPVPTRSGYAFLGWYTAATGGTKVTAQTVVTENMTVYARWTAAWTVTFNANGGKLAGEDGEVSTLKVPKAKGKAVGALPVPAKTGYAFKGWYTKKAGGTKITTKAKVTKNVTWYAQWTARKYAVKVVKDGKGTVSGAGSKAYQSKVTLKAKAASGYVFQGWYLDEVLKSQKATYSFKVPLDGVTYRAKFITKAEDKAGIGMMFGGVGFGAASETGELPVLPVMTNTCGVVTTWPVAASGLTPVSVTVTGQPKCMKYDAKKKAVTGVPSVANKSGTMKVMVKSAGASQTWSVKWRTVALPAFARGTFNGWTAIPLDDLDNVAPHALDPVRKVTVTVSSVGKITAKVGSLSLTRTGWTIDDDGFYRATLSATRTVGTGKKAKKYKDVMQFVLNPECDWLDDQLEGTFTSCLATTPNVAVNDDTVLTARRNSFGDNADAKALAVQLSALGTRSVTDGEGLVWKLKVSSSGVATITRTTGTGKNKKTVTATATVFFDCVGDDLYSTSAYFFVGGKVIQLPSIQSNGDDMPILFLADPAEPSDTPNGVQLWEGGPFWATTNIGAAEPWECGYYFWWGDTVGYKREGDVWVASNGSSSNFSFENAPSAGKDVSTLLSNGWISSYGVLASAHDAAHEQWGGEWRMPTDQDFSDLQRNCRLLWVTWTTRNGVKGYVVQGRGAYASKWIFLPAAGYGTGYSRSYARSGYWSSVPGSWEGVSWGFEINAEDLLSGVSAFDRSFGLPIRPVQGFAE